MRRWDGMEGVLGHAMIDMYMYVRSPITFANPAFAPGKLRWSAITTVPLVPAGGSLITHRYLITFGGQNGTNAVNGATSIADVTDADSVVTWRWLNVTIQGDRPAARYGHVLWAVNNMAILYGGSITSAVASYPEIWLLSPVTLPTATSYDTTWVWTVLTSISGTPFLPNLLFASTTLHTPITWHDSVSRTIPTNTIMMNALSGGRQDPPEGPSTNVRLMYITANDSNIRQIGVDVAVQIQALSVVWGPAWDGPTGQTRRYGEWHVCVRWGMYDVW